MELNMIVALVLVFKKAEMLNTKGAIATKILCVAMLSYIGCKKVFTALDWNNGMAVEDQIKSGMLFCVVCYILVLLEKYMKQNRGGTK